MLKFDLKSPIRDSNLIVIRTSLDSLGALCSEKIVESSYLMHHHVV